MMRQLSCIIPLAILGLTAHPAGAAPCPPIPDADVAPDEVLTRVEAARQAGALSILALGFPPDAAAGDALPAKLVEALRRAGLDKADVTVAGGRGLPAPDMLKLLDSALGRSAYQLVLWQTGTVETVRNTRPEEFYEALVDGIERATTAKADVVLIDPQFSHFLHANADAEPYEAAMQTAAGMPHAALFRRNDIMRAWAEAEDDPIDPERAEASARKDVVARLRACLAEALSGFLLRAPKPDQ